jgi:hypothetical protein
MIAFVKVLAVVVASLIIPLLAYIEHIKGNGSGKGNNGKGNYGAGKHIAVVPEANTGWVLIPFFGAVLLFSSRQLFRGKAAEKNAC